MLFVNYVFITFKHHNYMCLKPRMPDYMYIIVNALRNLLCNVVIHKTWLNKDGMQSAQCILCVIIIIVLNMGNKNGSSQLMPENWEIQFGVPRAIHISHTTHIFDH